jgi:hypothetical protein
MSETDPQQADHTEDPRKQETGSGGYPESTPGGTEGAGADDREREGDADAPSPSTDEEADRERSTGNPGAAG